jgi:ribose 1,5-bisphosphate isomerase
MADSAPIDTLIDRIERDLIGGAADMAKETAGALAGAARSSRAETGAAFREECLQYFERIVTATPSVMPVTFVLHLVASELEGRAGEPVAELRAVVVAAATAAADRIARSVERVAEVGGELLTDGEVLFTYSISSTVFATVRRARAMGKRVSLVTTESRPGNEGLQTLEVMAELGVPVTVGIDAALGVLMRGCTSVLIGGDTITAGGDALCKVGSFPTALAARHYGIPFRVAVDLSKLDPNTAVGIPLRIREMPWTDILADEAPAHVTVRNPVFEVIPARYVDALVTDAGIVAPAAASWLMDRIPRSEALADLVATQYRGDEAST